MIGKRCAHIGLQRKPGDALERRAFSGKGQRLQGLAPVSADDERIDSDVEASRLEGPDDGAVKFADWYCSEAIAQRFPPDLFILTAGHQVKWKFVHGCENVPNLPWRFWRRQAGEPIACVRLGEQTLHETVWKIVPD